jgi:hypothetical protein
MRLKTLDDVLEFDFRNNTNKQVLLENFCPREDGDNHIPFSTSITIKPGHKYFNNKEPIETTVGRYITNYFLFPKIYFDNYGFFNKKIDKKTYKEIAENVSLLLLSKKIDDKEYADFLDRLEWLGNTLSPIAANSYDSKSLVLHPKVKEALQKFFNEDKQRLNDPIYVKKKQKEIINLVKEYMGDTGLAKLISEGIKGNFDNNYKNTLLFRGIVDGEFIPDNLVDGNKFDTYVKLGKNAVKGSSSRAIDTAKGGYLTKLLSNAFNSLSLAEEDCGTDSYFPLYIISKQDIKKYLFRNVRLANSNDPFEPLTIDNIDKYIQKRLDMRSILFCRSKKGICKKCFGELYKFNGIEKNLSVYTTNISSDIMNTSMKAFHNLESDYTEVNFENEF